MQDLKSLGGIVKSEKQTYRIEVEQRQPQRGEVWLDAKYYVTVYNNETGDEVRKQGFTLRPQDTLEDLRAFVEDTKRAAKRDFSSNT